VVSEVKFIVGLGQTVIENVSARLEQLFAVPKTVILAMRQIEVEFVAVNGLIFPVPFRGKPIPI
jgi:hypothetical protein